MLKKGLFFLLAIAMIVTMIPCTIFAAGEPEIYKDSVTVRVGNTVKVDFTYGYTSTFANLIVSNTGIDASMTGETIYITGHQEGLSYVTLMFNDGTTDSIAVNVVGKYDNIADDNTMEVKKGSTKNLSIDLDLYDAKYATISYDTTVLTVNSTRFTSSGTLKVTGKNYGDSILRITYSTGETEVYQVTVVSNYTDSSDYDTEVLLDVDESFNYYVDLSDYDADKATVYYTSSYVKVNKSSFTYSGYLTLTARKEGESVVRVVYDTGDVEYIRVVCQELVSENDDISYVSVDSIEIEKGESTYFYVYLGDSASSATLSMSSYYASLSSTSLYTSGSVKITGNYVGTTELKVSFTDGTRVYIPVTVTEPNYLAGTAEIEKSTLLLNETVELELFMGSKNTYATITVDEPKKIALGVSDYSIYRTSYTINSSKNATVKVKITAKDLSDGTYITVKYPEGKTYKIMLSVIDLVKVEGTDKMGKNFYLRKGITVNQKVLDEGYIMGYGNGLFGTLNNITRQEFAVILSRILDYNQPVTSDDYAFDVTADWSKDCVAELVAMGIVDNNIAFRPTDYITRYEVADMLYKAVSLDGYSSACSLTDINPTTVLGEKVAKCWSAGLIAGYDNGTFGGNNNITRAEAVTLINRIFYKDMTTNKVNCFSDVSPDYWAYSYILKATKQ